MDYRDKEYTLNPDRDVHEPNPTESHPPSSSPPRFFRRKNSNRNRKSPSWYLLAYITANFVLGTFGIAAEARFNELTFVDARNFPGGPNAFVEAQYGDFVNIFGTAAYVVLNWLADGLVVRFRIILISNPN